MTSEIREALTIIRGRAQLARMRLHRAEGRRTEPQTRLQVILVFDMRAVDEAVNRVMATVEELEREVGIGTAVAFEGY